MLLLVGLEMNGSRKARKIETTIAMCLDNTILRIQGYLSQENAIADDRLEWHEVRPLLQTADVELIEAACSVDGSFSEELALGILFPATLSCGASSIQETFTKIKSSITFRQRRRKTTIGSRKRGIEAQELASQLEANELTQTLETGPLLAWLASASALATSDEEAGTSMAMFLAQACIPQLTRYLRINHMLAPWVEDSGRFGTYANNRRAAFWRQMMSANPCILDALLEGRPDQVAQLASGLQILYQAREKYSAKGRLSQLVVSTDRAPMAMFLAEAADDASRALIRSMLHEIYQSKISLLQTSKTLYFVGRYKPLVRMPRDLIRCSIVHYN